MSALLAMMLVLTTQAAPPPILEEPESWIEVDSTFTRVALADNKAARDRAVILIHGLNLFGGNHDKGDKVPLRSWQESDSDLVKQFVDYADVYALAYAQTVAVEKIHVGVKLRSRIRALKRFGYKEIILVGHSAGGLVARHFVEDYPDSGVTRVVQVCSPNAGTTLASLKLVGATRSFITSMSRTSRQAILKRRSDVSIPAKVEFACVVASYRLGGDGVVAYSSQWSEDLQKQHVPAYVIKAAHWDAVKTSDGAKAISRIVRESQPRWTDDEVKLGKKKVLGG